MAKAVEPFANLSAQELLKNSPRLFGWVRKEDIAGLRSVVKVLDWPWRYMILSAGCLYLYKTADDQNFMEAIPLTKFRVCDAPEKSKYTWMFKLIHESLGGKTLFFAVDSDFDLKKWKDAITESKIKYCSNTSQEDEEDGYSVIGDKVSQKPAPSLHAQSNRPRPPAPLPSSKRLHSHSSPPDPGTGSNLSRNTLPFPSRNQPLASADYSKSKPLPRPPCDPKPRPLTMGTFPRNRSESSSQATPAQGLGDVLSQLGNVKLRSPGIKGSASSLTLSSRDCSAAPGKLKNVNRGNPDGQSFKRKDREGVLPNSALRLDLDKLEVNSLLQNKQGVYIVRSSQSAQSRRALSVWTGDRIRHYVIFHKEDEGYALDPAGPRYHKMEDLLRHYYDFNLPNCDAKFTRPYK
ncbi:pleckstrin homology domain-containing family A member 6-like isoform X1 [Orbicella faveolata]|uniref:pleckstrin homology domain-containing family A member 6-like isoform X1 n=1 Tax=Orbicella faveolata TaxID=48498 RepID=UPI0009E62E95|nr:pleckstrin homology domain-containing family A member 6-like isoform X1 [Orbicella faveolata]